MVGMNVNTGVDVGIAVTCARHLISGEVVPSNVARMTQSETIELDHVYRYSVF